MWGDQGGPCARGQPLPAAGPILPGQGVWRGRGGGRGTRLHPGRRGQTGGVRSPALPPWLSPAAPWPGARPPCAALPGPPPATRPNLRGGWCRTPPSPGRAGRGVSPHRPPPQKRGTRPHTDPAAVVPVPPPRTPFTRAGGHHRGLWARWGETTPESCLPPTPHPRQGQILPGGIPAGLWQAEGWHSCSHRSGRERDTEPAPAPVPLLPGLSLEPGRRRGPPVPARCPPAVPPPEGKPAGTALSCVPPPQVVPWKWGKGAVGRLGVTPGQGWRWGGIGDPLLTPPAPGAGARVGGSRDTLRVPQPRGSGCCGGQ